MDRQHNRGYTYQPPVRTEVNGTAPGSKGATALGKTVILHHSEQIHLPEVEIQAAELLSRGGPLQSVRIARLNPLSYVMDGQRLKALRSTYGYTDPRATAAPHDEFRFFVGPTPIKVSRPCPMWFSIKGPAGALGVDALSHRRPRGLMYAFPPNTLVPQVLRTISLESASVILVAPHCCSTSLFERTSYHKSKGKLWHPKPSIPKVWVWPLNVTAL